MKKRTVLPEKKRFDRLVCFVERHGVAKVTAFATPNAMPIRGRVYLRKHVPSRIEIYVPLVATRRDWNQATAALVHEYGHALLRFTPHSEREAWTIGRRSVPREAINGSYKAFRRACLASYPINRRDHRICSAIGKGWQFRRKRAA